MVGNTLSWGVYTLAAAVNFLSVDCKIIHGQVCLASLFVDKGMDWKLGGFELMADSATADATEREKKVNKRQGLLVHTHTLMHAPIHTEKWESPPVNL